MLVRGAEDNELLAGNTSMNTPNRPLTSASVRRRLAFCLFLHIAGILIDSTPVVQGYYEQYICGGNAFPGLPEDTYSYVSFCFSMALGLCAQVVLEYFEHDDRKASVFSGWLTFSCSAVELIAVPSMSTASDAVGRRRVIAASLGLSGAAVLALGFRPDSIVAVAACQIVSSICGAIMPVSQAVIVDISLWDEGAGGGEVSHGLGTLAAAFGIALIVGPIFGGLASKDHRSLACGVCAGMTLLALLSLRFFGWTETAPARRVEIRTDTIGKRFCSSLRMVNPLSNVKILLQNSLMMQLSLCLFLYSLAINVYTIFYNYLDYRYHWGPLEISLFFSMCGVILALATGLGIRIIVPKLLSEGRGVVVGMLMHATAHIMYGIVPRGWMLYPINLVTAVQYIADPCVQAIMAKLVDEGCQGRLQGAITTLRIVAQGIAAPLYSQAFSIGLSNTFKNALGFGAPGLPLFLSAQFTLTAMMVASCALRQLDGALYTRTRSSSGRAGAIEEGKSTASFSFVDDPTKRAAVFEDDEPSSDISEPLLDGAAPGS